MKHTITNKFNKIIKFIKLVYVSLYNQVKNFFSLITQIFLILILTILAGYFNIPKIYFLILVFIFSFALNRYINSGYKLSSEVIKLRQKLVGPAKYLIIVAPLIFCLYLLDLGPPTILNIIYCEGTDTEDSDTEVSKDNNSDNKDKGKAVDRDSSRRGSSQAAKELGGQTYDILEKGIKAINRASDVLDKSMERLEVISNKALNVADKAMDKTADFVKENVPYAALAAVGGSSANKAMELVSHKGPKVMVTTGIAATTGIVVATGGTIEIIKTISKNKSLENLVNSEAVAYATSDSANPNEGVADANKAPDSPSDIGDGFINSSFEKEIPLISILDNLFILNYVELGLMFTILFIILRIYLNPKLKILVLKLLNYFFKNKAEFENKEIKINYIFDNLTKYSPYAIVFLFIILICIKLINLYFMFYLTENIDSFVKVYNHCKKQ